ncbi:MAG TPA: TIGR02266 family protein [Polyangiaceae bacterium]|nr:TIGR02266 family protein [Polyangiaceae bacterium]
MTQDTRKDRRVKIVSLNVRYKSATVDEFIENHAHDVSRGGIYIKTPSPFPAGTLLKFEIRLASDQAVITGVGRVVWKRDTTAGTGERPAGMGVKFIKLDDPSKGVIDKLVNSRVDAGQAYESESEAPNAEVPAPAAKLTPPSPNRSVGKSTMLGMGALPGPSRAPSVKPSAPAPRPAGSGAPSSASSASGGNMFPKTNSEAEMPPKQEQTVMKQAAELLEEALREAGGSMEEVGTNPLFAGTPGEAKGDPASPQPAVLGAKSYDEIQDDPVEKPAAPPREEAPKSAEEIAAEKARAAIAAMSPASIAPAPKKTTTEPPRTTRESPAAKAPERESSRPGSVRPGGRVAIASVPPRTVPEKKKRGGGGIILLLAVVVAAAFVGVMYRDTLFGSPPAPTAPPTPPPPPSASAAPSATEAASAAASASAAAMAADAAVANLEAGASDAAAATDAKANAAASAAPVHPIAPPPRPAAPHPTAVTPPTPPAPTEGEPATGTTSTATATPTATAAPKPKPTATGTAKPSDDNPY